MKKSKKSTIDQESHDMWQELQSHGIELNAQEKRNAEKHDESKRLVDVWLCMMAGQLDENYTGDARWDHVVYYLFMELIHIMQDNGATPNDLHDLIEEHHNENCRPEESEEQS